MSINRKQEALIKDMASLDDWFDKYKYLIELARQMKPIDNVHKTEDNLISGCQSRVWIYAELQDRCLHFEADSDTMITRGLLALTLMVCNNQTPRDIYETNFYFLEKVGVSSNLSPSRANGLASIVKQIKAIARGYL